MLFGVVQMPSRLVPGYRGVARPTPPPPENGTCESHPYAKGWVELSSEIPEYPGFTADRDLALSFLRAVQDKFGHGMYECILIQSAASKPETYVNADLLGYDVAQEDANSICKDYLLPSKTSRDRDMAACQLAIGQQAVDALVNDYSPLLNEHVLFQSVRVAEQCLMDARDIFDDLEEHCVQSVSCVAK